MFHLGSTLCKTMGEARCSLVYRSIMIGWWVHDPLLAAIDAGYDGFREIWLIVNHLDWKFAPQAYRDADQ